MTNLVPNWSEPINCLHSVGSGIRLTCFTGKSSGHLFMTPTLYQNLLAHLDGHRYLRVCPSLLTAPFWLQSSGTGLFRTSPPEVWTLMLLAPGPLRFSFPWRYSTLCLLRPYLSTNMWRYFASLSTPGWWCAVNTHTRTLAELWPWQALCEWIWRGKS